MSPADQPGAEELVSLSELIGCNVKDPRGHSLGEIADLIINTTNQRAVYALIESGGFFAPRRLYPVPLAMVRRTNRRTMVLDASREVIASAPSIAPEADAAWVDRRMQQKIRHHYCKGE